MLAAFYPPEIAAADAARHCEEETMRNSVRMLVVPALVLAAACGRTEDKSMDDGLKNDLSLASQMQAYPQQFVSPAELGYNGYGYGQPAQQPNGYYPMAPQPVAQRIYRAPTATRSAGTYSTGTTARTGTQTVKNTKRDAIIGGVAGAAIGAVTSRDKLKGAVIGGVAGSVLGAVIGNNVDVKKIPF
jgi:hypothetical protein